MPAQTTIGKLLVEIFLRDDEFQKGLKASQKNLKETGKQVAGLAGAVQKKLAVAWKALLAAVLGVLAASTALGSQFEKQMSAVAAVRGITRGVGEDYDLLAEKARELGATTSFSATQAAKGMEELARAGLQTNEIIAASNVALKLAGAGQVALGRSAQILASSMAQFSIPAEDSARIADVLTVATQNTLFATEDLAQSMKFAGTAGAAFGMSIEETTASVAQFRNLGLEGSMAGVQFRQSLAALASPTKQAQEALSRYNLVLEDVNPQSRSFRDIMVTIGEVGVTAGDAMAIFGSRVGGNVAKVARNMALSAENFDTLVTKLEDSAGATEKAYDTMTDNVVGRFQQIRSALEEVLISLFETFRGPLTELLDSVVGFLRVFAAEFGVQSDTISANFESIIGEINAFIQRNTQEGARNLARLIISLQDTAAAMLPLLSLLGRIAMSLSKLSPILDEVILLLLAAFAVKKAVAFANAMLVVVNAVRSATVAVAAFGAAANISTGGMVALAAVVSTLVIALGVYIKRTVSANRETRKLAEAQEELARQAQRGREQIDGALAFKLDATKRELQAEKDRLRAEEKLDAATRNRIDSMLRMTDAEAARAFRLGNLIALGDKLVRTEQALNQEGSEGRVAVEVRVRAVTARIAELQERLKTASGEAARLFRIELTEARTALVRLQNGLDSATGSLNAESEAALVQSAALAELTASLDKAGEKALALRGAEEEVTDATRDMVAELKAELASVGLDGLEALKQSTKAQKAEIERTFRDQIEDEKAQGVRLEELHERQAEALGLVDAIGAKKAAEMVRQERVTGEERTAEFLASIRRKSASKIEQIDMDMTRALLEHQELSVEEQVEVIEHFTALKVQAMEEAAEAAEDANDDTKRSFMDMARSVVKSMRSALVSVQDLVAGVTGLAGRVSDVVPKMSDLLGGFSFNLVDVVGSLDDAQREADRAAANGEAPVAEVTGASIVTQMVDAAIEFAEKFAEEAPKIVDALLTELPRLIETLTATFPGLALDLVSQLLAALPGIITMVADMLVVMVRDVLPVLIEEVLAALPEIITALLDAVVGIVGALVEALPRIVDAIIAALPKILSAVIEALPVLLEALFQLLPALLQAVLDLLPAVIVAVVHALPELITAIIASVPMIMTALIEALPELMGSLIAMIPVLVTEIITALPEIVVALVEATITEFVMKMPQIVAEFLKALVAGFGDAAKKIAEQVGKAIGDFFNIFKKKDKKGGKSAFTGIDYVPATMRMTLHKGERVVSADENARDAQFGGAGPHGGAGFGQQFGAAQQGSGGAVDLAVLVDGRLVDAAQVRAGRRGHGTKMVKEMRRAGGVRVGLSRGRFSSFSTR